MIDRSRNPLLPLAAAELRGDVSFLCCEPDEAGFALLRRLRPSHVRNVEPVKGHLADLAEKAPQRSVGAILSDIPLDMELEPRPEAIEARFRRISKALSADGFFAFHVGRESEHAALTQNALLRVFPEVYALDPEEEGLLIGARSPIDTQVLATKEWVMRRRPLEVIPAALPFADLQRIRKDAGARRAS